MLIRTLLLLSLLASGAMAQRPAPAGGYIQEFALDHVGSGPAIVGVDEQDNVWVALARSGKLARFANGVITLFDIGADSRPVGLAVGTRANGHPGVIWIAASYDNKLIRFDTLSGEKREYKIEGDDSWPFNVALAADGSVWFTQRASGRIGRLEASSGKIRHYEIPTPKSGPAGLAVDATSGRVWFTESYADRIAMLDPASGEVREFAMGESSSGLGNGPAGLAVDARGGVWFAKLEGKLGYLAPGAERIELFDAPAAARRPAGIMVAPNGDVWAAALDGNMLIRYQPAIRTFTTHPLPVGEVDERPSTPPFARTSRPFGIAADRQGNIWFSQQYTGQLGVLDISPPELTIVSPGPAVRSALVPLTFRALDRIGGVRRVTVRLDGRLVVPRHGRLDLRHVAPGRHRLEVTAADAGGHEATASVDFDYAPDHLALLETLRMLDPVGPGGGAAKAALIAAAGDLTRGDVRAKLQGLRRELAARSASLRPAEARSIRRLIDFQAGQIGQVVEVQVLDEAPYFSSTEMVVRTGDTLRFKYAPPSDGHSLSHHLHRIEIESLRVRSEMMKAGESFSYRFERPGTYVIRDGQRADARLLVKVVSHEPVKNETH